MNQMTDLKKRAVLSDVTNVCNMRHAKSAKISNIPDPRILMPSMEDATLKDDAAYVCTSANSDDICMLMPDCVSSMEGPTLKDDDNNQYAVTTQNPIHTQSVHPLLAMYVSDLPSSSLNWSQLQDLLNPENDLPLFDFLTSHGLIASSQQCEFCGGQMNRVKEDGRLLWMCRRRMFGSKCNRGKKSMRTGTVFANSNLTVQQIVSIFYHFVYRLSEKQCAQYVCVSSKSPKTMVKWYKLCREVCTSWFWDPTNTPKLGGYGVIVEIDESYLPGQPKYNRGRRLGTTWEDEQKWALGLVQRGSLDAIIQQVPSKRARIDLVPIIEKHTLPGTIYCSDSWKGYNELPLHVNLEDTLHYTVNHTKNYVDPITGAHTETIEGLWRHLKDFFPNGMLPKDSHSYIGAFLWHRYCKQRRLDLFIHFLKCCAQIHPPKQFSLPSAAMMKTQPPPYDDDFAP